MAMEDSSFNSDRFKHMGGIQITCFFFCNAFFTLVDLAIPFIYGTNVFCLSVFVVHGLQHPFLARPVTDDGVAFHSIEFHFAGLVASVPEEAHFPLFPVLDEGYVFVPINDWMLAIFVNNDIVIVVVIFQEWNVEV